MRKNRAILFLIVVMSGIFLLLPSITAHNHVLTSEQPQQMANSMQQNSVNTDVEEASETRTNSVNTEENHISDRSTIYNRRTNQQKYHDVKPSYGTRYTNYYEQVKTDPIPLKDGETRENEPPEIPEMIYGPSVAEPEDLCAFVTSTIDPDGDDLYYQWSWGDGEITEWIGPYPSGVDVGGLKAWDEENYYDIRVRVKDTEGHQTSWSEPHSIHIRVLRGDMNVDGTVNLCDIDPFVQALCHPDDYISSYGEDNYWRADINCDGAINGFDIDPFRCVLGLCGC